MRKSAWEKLKIYVDNIVSREADKYQDGYNNQYDEWLDVQTKLASIDKHEQELRDTEELLRTEIKRRDRVLIKYNLMHELIK